MEHGSIIAIALCHWIARCKKEAELMRQWAVDFPDNADKCEANAKASEAMARDAQAALDAM